MRHPSPSTAFIAVLVVFAGATVAVAATPAERATAIAATLAQAKELGADKRCPDDFRVA